MYTFEALEEYNFHDLEEGWQFLCADATEQSIFVDWFWISTWLKSIQPLKPVWISVKWQEKCVGMALVCVTSTYKFPLLPSFKTGWLHKTGQQHLDQIWIEHNDVLALPGHKAGVIDCLFEWGTSQQIAEWRIAITTHPEDYTKNRAFFCDIQKIPGFEVSLTPDMSTVDDYLATRSRNTRSNIRRSQRFLEQNFGPIQLAVHTLQLPEPMFEHMRQLHIERWQEDSEGSGFNNPDFNQFHRRLMDTESTLCRTEVMACYAGERCLGYLYNLIKGKRVYFYLSSIDYVDSENRCKPGLVMHTHAIAYYANQGMTSYDFMGGDSQYKRSLSNRQYDFTYLILRRRTLVNGLLNLLRTVKAYIRTLR